MKKKFESVNPERTVLIAWLREAADGGVTPAAMRRLCFEAATMLDLVNAQPPEPVSDDRAITKS